MRGVEVTPAQGVVLFLADTFLIRSDLPDRIRSGTLRRADYLPRDPNEQFMHSPFIPFPLAYRIHNAETLILPSSTKSALLENHAEDILGLIPTEGVRDAVRMRTGLHDGRLWLFSEIKHTTGNEASRFYYRAIESLWDRSKGEQIANMLAGLLRGRPTSGVHIVHTATS